MGFFDRFRRKPQKSSDQGTRTMAMVLLREAELPDAHALVHHLRTTWPDSRFELGEGSGQGDDEQVIMIRSRRGTGAVMLMPMPIPDDSLDWPCATAWDWPEAAAIVGTHQAHAIVFMSLEENDPVVSALETTRLVAAVAKLASGVGVYWCNAARVLEAGRFIDEARESTAAEPPLLLWIAIHPVPSEAGLDAYTSGLESFGHPELEVHASTLDPYETIG